MLLAIARTMAYTTRLLHRTVWSFIAGLLTGLMILHFNASNEHSLYDGENDEGKSSRSHQQRDLHNDLEDGRIPAKGTFLSLLNVKIVSLVMERIKHYNTCYIKTNYIDKSNYRPVMRTLLERL